MTTPLFDIEHVLAHGILNPEHQDTLVVDWKLVEGCNYACSYCHLENPRVQETFSREQLLTTARHILELGRSHYSFRLYGGEPTLHPFLPDLLYYLRGSGQSLSIEINTNASRSAAYFRHISSLVVPPTLRMELSVHPEYLAFSHLKEVITLLAEAGHSCGIDLVLLPTHKARCRDYYAQLCNLRMKYAFHLSCSFLYQGEDFSTLDPEYTAEDIHWARQARESFVRSARQSGLKLPDRCEQEKPCYRIQSDDEIRMVPDDSSVSDLPERFTNFYCCAGTNFLHIEPDGTFRGGDCSIIAAWPKKIHQEKPDYAALPHLVRCKGDCDGTSCAVLPKFRHASEAEKCLKEYKERALGLRQAVHLVPTPFSPEPTPEQRVLARLKRLEMVQTPKSPLEPALVRERLLEDRLKDIAIIYDALADTDSRVAFLRLLKTVTTGDNRYLGLSLYPRFEHPLVRSDVQDEVLTIHSFEMPTQPLPNVPSFLRVEVVKQEKDFFNALECLIDDYHPSVELSLPSEPDIWLETALRFIRNHPEYTLYMGQHNPEVPLPCLYARPSARFRQSLYISEESKVPSVSVIVSSSENEPSLRRCLDSLLLQDIQDLEIIVVHNKGAEQIDKLVETYACRYPALLRHLVVPEKIKAVEAWNKGIHIALGKTCIFLSDKEQVTSRFLKRCLECLETEQADIVACGAVTHFMDGKEEQEVIHPGTWNGTESLRHLLLEDAGDILSPARMYRTAFIRERCIRHDEHMPLSFAVRAFYHSRKTVALSDIPGIIYFEASTGTDSSENRLYTFFRQAAFLTSFFSAHGLASIDFALEQCLRRYYEQVRTALSLTALEAKGQEAFSEDKEAFSCLGRSSFALQLFLVDYALLYCHQKNLRPYVALGDRDWQNAANLTEREGICIPYGQADAPQKAVPLLSVIIPNYNKAKYLKQSLNSILSQSMPDFECIIIDDASTDESMELLQDYADLHDCIRLYRMSVNSRQGICRNIGMEKARGRFLVFIDSDDTAEPDFFSIAVRIIQKEQADIVVFATQHRDSKGNVTWSRSSEEGRTSGKEAVEALFKGTIGPEPWGKIFNTTFLKEKGIRFPEHVYHQDEPFVECALRKSRVVALRPEVVYRNLLSEGSVLRPHSQTYLHAHSACVYYAFLQHIADSEPMSPEALTGIKEHLIWNLEHVFLPTCAAFWEAAQTLPLTSEDVAQLCRSPLFLQALVTGYTGCLSQDSLPEGLLPVLPLPARATFRQSAEHPLLSAILPVQNQEKTIAACLESIRQQNLKAFETLIVDDASIDGTSALCRAQIRQDSRIFLTVKPVGEGAAAACSTGLEKAQGKYITFVSASATFLPNFFLHGVMLLERHSELDAIVYTSCSEKEQDEQVCTGSEWLENLSRSSNADAWKLGCKIFRREVLEQSGMPFSDPCVENVFLWSVYARARRILICRRDGFVLTPPEPAGLTTSFLRPVAESFHALFRLAAECSSLLFQKGVLVSEQKPYLLQKVALLFKNHIASLALCTHPETFPLDDACLQQLSAAPALVRLILEEFADLYVQRADRPFRLAAKDRDSLCETAHVTPCLIPLLVSASVETKQMIRLSIILLVTNAASTLPHCLNSILDQIEPDMEILLFVQNTTDDTLAICQEYAQKAECIRLFRIIPTTDMGRVRQLAVREAVGSHFLFVEANSWLAPDYLNTASRLLDEDPACDGFFFGHQEWDPAGNSVLRQQTRPEAVLNAIDAVHLYIREGAHGMLSGSRIYRKAFLMEQQILFTSPGIEDNLFLLESCIKGNRFRTIHCIAVNVRVTNEACFQDALCLSHDDFDNVVSLVQHTKQLFASSLLPEEIASLGSECLHSYAQGTCGSALLGFVHLCKSENRPSPLREEIIDVFSGAFLKSLLYRYAVLSVTPLTPTVLPPQSTKALPCPQKKKETVLSVTQEAPAGTPPPAIAMLKDENLVDPELWTTSPRDALVLMLRRSGFFDWAYYWRMYPDIADAKLDPIEHYVDYGAAEKWRDPAPWFDTSFYLDENSDVRREGINPFYHYLMHGYHEQRRPNKSCQKKNEQPKVSVIVPVYNNAQYLYECMDSIVNQMLQEIEIICVDDGSTDKSSEILDEYARKDPRIKVIHKKNTGYGHSMNVGLNAATGEYIGIVESDDYILPEMYETLYQTAKKYDVDFVKSDFKRFYGDKENRIFEDRFLTEDKTIYEKVLNPQQNFSLFHLNNVIWNGIYSRYYLLNNDIYFNETCSNEYKEIIFPSYAKNSRVFYIKKTFYFSRSKNKNFDFLKKEKKDIQNIDKTSFLTTEEKLKDYKDINPKLYCEEVKKWYKLKTGKDLALDNPQTFNEKIQWIKIYDNSPLKSYLADKYLVRKWVKEKIGEKYLIPLIGVWNNFDDIDFKLFPKKFVLKANHGCGWNIIVKDKNSFNKNNAKKKFDKWMNMNFAFQAGFELHYLNIKPMIIAEEYIENGEDELYDYKVWCFHGKPNYIQFVYQRNKLSEPKRIFFDTQWNIQNFTFNNELPTKTTIEKPSNLNELLSISSTLSNGFKYARIDFYRLNDGTLKFGEITFTPMSGNCRWNPESYDKKLGDLLNVSNSIKISIIIPVYNSSCFLNTCLNSIIEQDFNDIEIICVDDGSTDNSYEILKMYSQKDSRFIIIKQNNLGAGVARNVGLRQAKGEFIIFLDADDFFEKDAFKILYEKAKSSGSDIIVFKAQEYDTKTQKFNDCKFDVNKELLPQKDVFNYHDFSEVFFQAITTSPWNKFFKKEFISLYDISFQNTPNSNDVFFVYTLLVLAKRISFIEKIFINYRINNKYSLQRSKFKSWESVCIAFLKLKDKLIELEVYNELKRSFINKALQSCLYYLNTINGKAKKDLYFSLKNDYFFKLDIHDYGKDFFYKEVAYNQFIDIINLDTIPIVYASDNNYAPFLNVSMTSIMENLSSNINIVFYVLISSSFNKENILNIKTIEKKYNKCKVIFLDMKDKFTNINMKIKHITCATYYRLLIPNLIENYKKIIYLDSDVIVNSDIFELYNNSLDKFYIAGIKAAGYHMHKEYNCKRLNLNSIDQYVNAGVLIMNLEKIKKDNLVNKFMELIKRNYSSQDQDILNVACAGCIKILPLKYNLMTTLYEDDKFIKSIEGGIYTQVEVEEAQRSPQIIHYCDKRKPWNYLDIPFSNYFWKYAEKSLYYNKIKNDLLN